MSLRWSSPTVVQRPAIVIGVLSRRSMSLLRMDTALSRPCPSPDTGCGTDTWLLGDISGLVCSAAGVSRLDGIGTGIADDGKSDTPLNARLSRFCSGLTERVRQR